MATYIFLCSSCLPFHLFRFYSDDKDYMEALLEHRVFLAIINTGFLDFYRFQSIDVRIINKFVLFVIHALIALQSSINCVPTE